MFFVVSFECFFELVETQQIHRIDVVVVLLFQSLLIELIHDIGEDFFIDQLPKGGQEHQPYLVLADAELHEVLSGQLLFILVNLFHQNVFELVEKGHHQSSKLVHVEILEFFLEVHEHVVETHDRQFDSTEILLSEKESQRGDVHQLVFFFYHFEVGEEVEAYESQVLVDEGPYFRVPIFLLQKQSCFFLKNKTKNAREGLDGRVHVGFAKVQQLEIGRDPVNLLSLFQVRVEVLREGQSSFGHFQRVFEFVNSPEEVSGFRNVLLSGQREKELSVFLLFGSFLDFPIKKLPFSGFVFAEEFHLVDKSPGFQLRLSLILCQFVGLVDQLVSRSSFFYVEFLLVLFSVLVHQGVL